MMMKIAKNFRYFIDKKRILNYYPQATRAVPRSMRATAIVSETISRLVKYSLKNLGAILVRAKTRINKNAYCKPARAFTSATDPKAIAYCTITVPMMESALSPNTKTKKFFFLSAEERGFLFDLKAERTTGSDSKNIPTKPTDPFVQTKVVKNG